MTQNLLLKRVLSTDLTAVLPEAGIALLRVLTALLVATLHGWHKMVHGWHYLTADADWPLLHDTIQLGFPLPVAFTILAALSQFVGGCLLALGAGTRFAAFLVASTMFTAVVFNLQNGGPDAQLAGLYALVTGAFVLIGGGQWSIDRYLLGDPRNVDSGAHRHQRV